MVALALANLNLVRTALAACQLALLLMRGAEVQATRGPPRRSDIQSAGESYLLSPMYFSIDKTLEIINDQAFTSMDCAVDALCAARQYLKLARAVVTLTHPLKGNSCTGTLIRNEGGSVFVITAWHCVGIDRVTFSYPWSSYGVFLNYKLPCNTTRIGNAVQELGGQNMLVLQGLRLVWLSMEADTALFELLSDIYPAASAYLQGWDATGADLDPQAVQGQYRGWVNFNHPSGDLMKFTQGSNILPFHNETFSREDNSLTADFATPCSGAQCGFMATLFQVGTFEGGSSGSGFVDLATQRLVGVLSGGAGHYCGVGDLDWLLAQHQKPNSPYGFENYGRLQKAWAMGLWDPLGGTGPDAPLSRDGEEYLVPQPGVVIGNPAPLYIQGGLQQTMQIWLTAPPPSGRPSVTLSLSTPGTQQLVTLMPDSLIFYSYNWGVPQYVTVMQGPDTLPAGAPPTSFDVQLSWPAVDALGKAVTRTKLLKGVYKLDVPGSDWTNPLILESLPAKGSLNMAAFATDDEFISNNEGPFIPTAFMQYTTPLPQGVVVTLCPQAGSNFEPKCLFMDWRRKFYGLLPQVYDSTAAKGCFTLSALLDTQTTYYLLSFPKFDFSVPGAVPKPQGNLTYDISTKEPYDLITWLAGQGFVQRVKNIPYQKELDMPMYGVPRVLLLEATTTQLLDISTCDTVLDLATYLAINDATTLEPIIGAVPSGGLLSKKCAAMQGVAVAKGKPYLIVVGMNAALATLGRWQTKFNLTVTPSASAAEGSD